MEAPAKFRPVILSGGSGTRLWPLSRSQFPKQFAPLMGDETLFDATLRRINDRSRYAAPIIVGNADHKFFIQDALNRQHIDDALIVLEPIGRNTAPAAIIAAMAEPESDTGILHLVMPSDHLVSDETAFHAYVASAARVAQLGEIVLFGITPDRPETGYGYIIAADPIKQSEVRHISLFAEKPDHAKALALIDKGALWNSGIFLYDPRTVCQEAEKLAPAHYASCQGAWDNRNSDKNSVLLDKRAYESMQNHAFDTLIMEATKHGAVLPCSMGWSDVGSWRALWELAPQDSDGNALIGPVITQDVSSSYVRSEGPLIAMLGMKDCTVVATKDVVMVAPSARSQEIKGLLSLVERSHREIATSHTRVSRPWGTYESIAQGQNFRVKHIVVQPGRSLSLQMHHHRAEHWVVVAGTARVECDGIEKLLFPNQSVFVPQGATHRLTNPGKVDLQLIEVQSGEYLNEDDIVRFEDLYGRVPEAKTPS
jgi:mannose-1-phosphate guanylyltransferase/mannose-6-phosphate isomerase